MSVRHPWPKEEVNSDKVVSATGDTFLELSGSEAVNLDGDTLPVSITASADYIISLLGSVGVSLDAAKNIATLYGEFAKSIDLIGDYPYSYFNVTIDSTYITIDFTDITIDRNLELGHV